MVGVFQKRSQLHPAFMIKLLADRGAVNHLTAPGRAGCSRRPGWEANSCSERPEVPAQLRAMPSSVPCQPCLCCCTTHSFRGIPGGKGAKPWAAAPARPGQTQALSGVWRNPGATCHQLPSSQLLRVIYSSAPAFEQHRCLSETSFP